MRIIVYVVLSLCYLGAPCASAWAEVISLSWEPSSYGDVVGYRVYYGTAPHDYTEVLDAGDIAGVTIGDLASGKKYYFAVTAYDGSGNESALSNEVSAWVGQPPDGGGSHSEPIGGGCGRLKKTDAAANTSPARAITYLMTMFVPLFLRILRRFVQMIMIPRMRATRTAFSLDKRNALCRDTVRLAIIFFVIAVIPTLSFAYSGTSPHWTHIRLEKTDFRIRYVSSSSQRKTEYDWTAQHYDSIMGGDLWEYKKRNSTIQHYNYALNWTLILPPEPDNLGSAYSSDMAAWYAGHPQYNMENAFLHDAAQCPSSAGKTPACRIKLWIGGTQRQAVFPGDPGLQQYQMNRLSRLIRGPYRGYQEDGIFFDEHASGSMAMLKSYNLREYSAVPDPWAAYQNDMLYLLSLEKTALGPGKLLMLNTSTYMTPFDSSMVLAAGAAQMESANNPGTDLVESSWGFIENLLSKGIVVDFVGLDYGATPAGYTSGHSPTPLQRTKLWELASYYMVVPDPPDNLTFDINGGWDQPFSLEWVKAVEANIGKPLGARRVYQEGTDPNGKSYKIWIRDFENAVVLVRPIGVWSYKTYDDTTGITVLLPSGDNYIPIQADGSLGLPTTSITLDNSESALLLKQSRMSAVGPTILPSAPTRLRVK